MNPYKIKQFNKSMLFYGAQLAGRGADDYFHSSFGSGPIVIFGSGSGAHNLGSGSDSTTLSGVDGDKYNFHRMREGIVWPQM